MVASAFNDILRTINYGIEQIRLNSWYLFLFVIAVYFLKHQVKKLRYNMTGVTLGQTNTGNKRNQHRSSRDEELYQTRLHQQEIYNERAKEILAQRRKKENEEVANHLQPSLDKDSSEKSKKPMRPTSTKSKSTTTGYNPMQPWTSSAGGGSYRPSPRTTSRRG